MAVPPLIISVALCSLSPASLASSCSLMPSFPSPPAPDPFALIASFTWNVHSPPPFITGLLPFLYLSFNTNIT